MFLVPIETGGNLFATEQDEQVPADLREPRPLWDSLDSPILPKYSRSANVRKQLKAKATSRVVQVNTTVRLSQFCRRKCVRFRLCGRQKVCFLTKMSQGD